MIPLIGVSIAERLRDRGFDRCIRSDDLSKHSRSYRQTSPLQNKIPSRDAYPSDVFNIHSTLLSILLFPYLFMIFIFSSRSPFFVLLFQYFYLLYPCFFFKGPIHLIEVYTGLNPCPLYHIYYYSCLSIVSLILVLLCLVLFNDRP